MSRIIDRIFPLLSVAAFALGACTSPDASLFVEDSSEKASSGQDSSEQDDEKAKGASGGKSSPTPGVTSSLPIPSSSGVDFSSAPGATDTHSTKEGPASSAGDHSSPDTGTQSGSNPDQNPSGESGPEPAPPGSIEIESLQADGDGCILMGFGQNATLIVTESVPNGPKDYFQLTLDGMEINSEGWTLNSQCSVTAKLRWKPNTRVVVALEQDGFVSSTQAMAKTSLKLRNQINFESGHGVTKTKGYGDDKELDYDLKWSPADIGAYSDCSGSGEFQLLVELNVENPGQNTKFSMTLDRLSGLFRPPLVGEGEFPACP